jgi:diaminopimelate decarboxylase
MPESFVDNLDLEAISHRVGTPFFIYSAEVLRRRIADVQAVTNHPLLQARYAMKACSSRRVLEVVHESGLWIDAVSGNEVLRAITAGFRGGTEPPEVLFTADVFRDNALDVVREHGILPNLGSPAMLDELVAAGYHGPIGVRLNPGFGHGHVSATDTGGPSSKHGIWYGDEEAIRDAAARAGCPIVLLHAHVGSGPAIDEFSANMGKLAHFFVERVSSYPALEAVSLGGGLPHAYRPDRPTIELAPLRRVLLDAQARISEQASTPIRLEIEPGRYLVAASAALVTRVTDVKATRANDRGPGHVFAMVDAGFNDLIRPAMYGSYHHITLYGAARDGPPEPIVVAGPLCESGDVFTRGADELIEPRQLPRPARGDLLILHDAGAYGVAMSSNYVSLGRAPQVWLEDGQVYLMSRREGIEDVTRRECFERL